VAEERDDASKTEEPTQKRLDEAREKGQVASSREVASFLVLGAALAVWAGLGPAAGERLAGAMAAMLDGAGTLRLDPADAGRLLLAGLGLTALAAGLPLLLNLALPVAAAALQNAVVWSTESLGFKAERVSPLAGAKRLFGGKALVEFAKGLVKLALVTGAVALALWPERGRVAAAHALPLGAQLAHLDALVVRLLAAAAAAVGLLAVLDAAHARFAHLRELRMTRQEVLDEHKQNEGDPVVKQRLKAIRLERARRRMMADVPRSTVVITNPTHYAVALRYVQGETAAPQVLAKGVDEVARRIREVAAEHRVPVVENAPLARALHAQCEIGAMIPPAHYQAVAEIVGYVLRLAGSGGRPEAPPPRGRPPA
jgi:flagellar biosynthesis protein FlhB